MSFNGLGHDPPVLGAHWGPLRDPKCHPCKGHLQCGGHEGEPSHGEDAAGRHAAGSADEEVPIFGPEFHRNLSTEL